MISGVKKITGTGSAKAISGRLQYENRIGGKIPLAAFSPALQGLMFSMGCVDLGGKINPNFIGNAEAFCQSKPSELGLNLQKAVLPVLDILTQMEDLKAEDNYFIDALRLGDNRSVTLTACFARAILASIPAFLTVTGIVSGVLPVLGAGIALGLAVVSLVRDFKVRKQIQQNIEEFIKSQNPIDFGFQEKESKSSVKCQEDDPDFFGTAAELVANPKRDLDGPGAFETAILPAIKQSELPSQIIATSERISELRSNGGLDYFISWLTAKYLGKVIVGQGISGYRDFPSGGDFLFIILRNLKGVILNIAQMGENLTTEIEKKALSIWNTQFKNNTISPTRQLGSQRLEYQIAKEAMLYFQKQFRKVPFAKAKEVEELENPYFFATLLCLFGGFPPLKILYQAFCLPNKDTAMKAFSKIESEFNIKIDQMTEKEKIDCARVIAGLLNGENVGNFVIAEAGENFSFSLLPEVREEASQIINGQRNWSKFALQVRQELQFQSSNELPRIW